MSEKKSVVLGVTHARSLGLLAGVAERMVDAGWDVHIVTAPGKRMAVYEGTKAQVHTIPMTRQPSIWKDCRSLVSWMRLMNKLSPDAILVGTPKAGLLGILSAWITRVPVRIYHLRGLRLESTKGFARTLLWFLEKVAFTLSTHTLAVSKSLANQVIASKLVPAKKVTVLGQGSSNGVDLERYKPVSNSSLCEKLGLAPGIPVVGYVGRITKDKGSRELLEASLKLHKWGIEHQLLIVGDEDEDRLLSSFDSTQMQHAPIVIGRVEDTAPYYNVMDLLCLPTYREGFPNVVLEAAASGIPAITTDATGAVDAVVDGHTGLIVSKKSSGELASGLAELLTSEPKRQQMGARAHQYVAAYFERSAVQDNLIGFLRSLFSSANKFI